MLNITCDNYTAAVEAKGSTKTLYIESLGCILEGFKLIRCLNNTLYEKTKEDIFIALLDGKLDTCTEPGDETEGEEIRCDLNGLLDQLRQEEGET